MRGERARGGEKVTNIALGLIHPRRHHAKKFCVGEGITETDRFWTHEKFTSRNLKYTSSNKSGIKKEERKKNKKKEKMKKIERNETKYRCTDERKS